MIENIQQIIDSAIKPYLHAHGGDIEVVSVQDGIVTIKLFGACSGCPQADTATRSRIEHSLQAHIPEIRAVKISHEVHPELIAMAKKILGSSTKCRHT